jgi:hypothetical protein
MVVVSSGKPPEAANVEEVDDDPETETEDIDENSTEDTDTMEGTSDGQ